MLGTRYRSVGTRFSQVFGTQIGSLKRLKNPDIVYIHMGVIRAIWASVVCNLDHCINKSNYR